VRDMVTGATRTASVRVSRSAVGVGARLALSDDSRYLVFDPRVGGKDPALLIDMRTGRTVSIPARYNTISVQGGVALLVRYRKTDLWLMPVDGHAPKPVRFKGTFILFSELAPDGRTVSAVELDEYNTKRITLLDAKTGRILRKVTIRGLPKDAYLSYGAVWRSGSELIVHSYYKNSMRAYAVDVGTGKARQIATYEGYLERLISMPGIVAQ
jgi:Tol biopolymer transport system component